MKQSICILLILTQSLLLHSHFHPVESSLTVLTLAEAEKEWISEVARKEMRSITYRQSMIMF